MVAKPLRPVPRWDAGADQHAAATPGLDGRAPSAARPRPRTSSRRAPPADRTSRHRPARTARSKAVRCPSPGGRVRPPRGHRRAPRPGGARGASRRAPSAGARPSTRVVHHVSPVGILDNWRFCPRCGGSLSIEDRSSRMRCLWGAVLGELDPGGRGSSSGTAACCSPVAGVSRGSATRNSRAGS